jgi:large subunit ribosomal protein L13
MAVVDATGHVLGRLSSHVAKRLLEGEEIVIVNAEKVVITGKRQAILGEYRKMREIGGQRGGPKFPRRPDLILRRTVRGMVPHRKPRGRTAMKRLRVYMGVPDEYEGEELETIDDARHRGAVTSLNLGEVCRELGFKI